MLIKLGVSIGKLRRPIRRILPLIDQVFIEVTETEAVITSTFEGTHSAGSLHYCDLAIDIRLPKSRVKTDEVFDMLKEKLGKSYDVVMSNNCIHIEWDPK